MEYAMIDTQSSRSIVMIDQIGWTTKILALPTVKLVRFMPSGNRYDTIGVEPLIHGIDGGLLAEAFDCNWIKELNERGASYGNRSILKSQACILKQKAHRPPKLGRPSMSSLNGRKTSPRIHRRPGPLKYRQGRSFHRRPEPPRSHRSSVPWTYPHVGRFPGAPR